MADRVQRVPIWLNRERVERLRALYQMPPEAALREEMALQLVVLPRCEDQKQR